MAGGAIYNNIYNQYLTTYSSKKSLGQYDTHKTSELRSIYNSIVKLNKETPLYILDTSSNAKNYAVDIKENARALTGTIHSLNGTDEELLSSKTAYSSNENIVSAKYIGPPVNTEDAPTYEIEVKSLASPQVNMGSYLPNSKIGLTPGTYSFDVGINDLSYEFQYKIEESDTNSDIQNKLSRLINHSGIGLESEVVSDQDGSTSLKIASTKVGLDFGKEHHFRISDDKSSKTTGSVSYLGIDETVRQATNASFVINGAESYAFSNNFTIEKNYEVILNGVSQEDGDTATIGLKPDLESLTDNIHLLVNSYNSFLKAASEYTERQTGSNRLLNEVGNISSFYKNELDSMGLQIQQDGSIEIDSSLLSDATQQENAKELLSPLKDFSSSLLRKSAQVSLNPMNYVDKTIVAYKNPGRNFTSPYVTSAYSGMMFSSYC